MMIHQLATWPGKRILIAKIAIVPSAAISAPNWRELRLPRQRELATMASTYHDNVSSRVQQPVQAPPEIRTIGLSDLRRALELGWEDFKAVPSHAVILCVIYPVLGLLLARAAFGYAVIPLLFPLAAGFALLGPFAALGLYELSSRRERGEEPSAWDAVEVLRSPSFGAMLGLGVLLFALFVTWVAIAQAIYVAAFGNEAAAEI